MPTQPSIKDVFTRLADHLREAAGLAQELADRATPVSPHSMPPVRDRPPIRVYGTRYPRRRQH